MFQTPATIQSVSTLIDGGNKLSVITRELNAEEMTALFAQKGKEGWFCFKENPLTPEDIKDLPEIKDEFDKKTPSQRQRAIIWRIWELTDQKKTFNDFYIEQMEKINQWLKEKLN